MDPEMKELVRDLRDAIRGFEEAIKMMKQLAPYGLAVLVALHPTTAAAITALLPHVGK